MPRSSTRYCVTCHDEDEKKGGLALDTVALQDVSQHPDVWEKVVRKLRARQMPPVGKKDRPDERHLRRGDCVSRDVARPRGGDASEPGPHRHHPAPHANRISERRPRSPRARDRRRVAAPRRRVELWLRQRDGWRSLADAPRPLRVSGGEDQPVGDWARLAARPAATPSGFNRISPRRNTSRGCRSGRAAGRSSTTRSRWTASTSSRFA